MQLGYVILYVTDVQASLEFYERAFGLARGYVAQSGDYAELQTGPTALGLCSRAFVRESMPAGEPDPKAPVNEIGLVTEDVEAAIGRAVAAGATKIADPKQTPWGQAIAYVSDPDGFCIELCTPIAS